MCVCCFWATLMENGIFLEDDGVEEEVEEAATTLHCWWTSSTLTSRLSPSHLSLKKKWKKIKKKLEKKTTILPPIENPLRAAFSTGVGTWALTLLFLPLLFLFYMHMPRPLFPLTTTLFWQDRKMRKVGKNYDAYACFSFSALILISKFLF